MKTMTTVSDAELDRAVTLELAWDPRVDDKTIAVSVKNGIVTLAGFVDSYAKKLAARDAAHSVNGVMDVADEIQVKYSGPVRNDVELAKNVRQALVWDIYVPDQRIKSAVSNGWVTLEGEVDHAHQREDAARAIERLQGVVEVTNLITEKSLRVDPKQIQGAIQGALLRRAQREAKRIDVSVSGGTVKLMGTVHSWAERNAVERVALYSPGVSKVENSVVVDAYA